MMVYRNEPSSEQEPLLSGDDQTCNRSHYSLIHTTHSPQKVIILITLFIFTVYFGASLAEIPSLQITEDIICRQFYENVREGRLIDLHGTIGQHPCKEDEIQNELNLVITVENFLDAIPGMLLTIPYGLLADRIGRKRVCGIALVGLLMKMCWDISVLWFWKTFPIRLVWISPIFLLLGGGGATAGAMVNSIISDVTTEENR